MAEPTQFSFSLYEATVALIKEQGLHEGLWLLGFEFGHAAGMVGNSPEDAKPTAFVQINNLQLVRQNEAAPPTPLVVDAANVNPAPKKISAKAKQPRQP
jgi:hypothetical protein